MCRNKPGQVSKMDRKVAKALQRVLSNSSQLAISRLRASTAVTTTTNNNMLDSSTTTLLVNPNTMIMQRTMARTDTPLMPLSNRSRLKVAQIHLILCLHSHPKAHTLRLESPTLTSRVPILSQQTKSTTVTIRTRMLLKIMVTLHKTESGVKHKDSKIRDIMAMPIIQHSHRASLSRHSTAKITSMATKTK